MQLPSVAGHGDSLLSSDPSPSERSGEDWAGGWASAQRVRPSWKEAGWGEGQRDTGLGSPEPGAGMPGARARVPGFAP